MSGETLNIYAGVGGYVFDIVMNPIFSFDQLLLSGC